jgi:hypothetical protein
MFALILSPNAIADGRNVALFICLLVDHVFAKTLPLAGCSAAFISRAIGNTRIPPRALAEDCTT